MTVQSRVLHSPHLRLFFFALFIIIGAFLITTFKPELTGKQVLSTTPTLESTTSTVTVPAISYATSATGDILHLELQTGEDYVACSVTPLGDQSSVPSVTPRLPDGRALPTYSEGGPNFQHTTITLIRILGECENALVAPEDLLKIIDNPSRLSPVSYDLLLSLEEVVCPQPAPTASYQNIPEVIDAAWEAYETMDGGTAIYNIYSTTLYGALAAPGSTLFAQAAQSKSCIVPVYVGWKCTATQKVQPNQDCTVLAVD